MNLPVEIYTADAVRRIDRLAMEAAGIDGYTLMARAARAALEEACREYPSARHWQVLCGAGNNGGDGYVLARLAAAQGIRVSLLALTPPERLGGDAATACRDFIASGGRVQPWQGALDSHADLLVDAILGSGLTRPVTGEYAAAVSAVNRHPAAVMALDLPSGLCADRGEVLGTAVRADLTVVFVALKRGLFLARGPQHVGRLRFAGLGIPDACRTDFAPVLRRLGDEFLARALAPRAHNAHKGDFGHVLLVGGAPGMGGALRLSAEAALRAGAGRVSVATHPAHCPAFHAGCPEVMCHGIERAGALAPLLERATVVAIGPGLSTGDWGRALWAAVRSAPQPAVVDADALNLLASAPARRDAWILTPHPGEAGRLLGSDAAAVQADRLGALAGLVERYGGTAVLKGAGTLISATDGAPWLSHAGNPGMATAGMGDVLTGVIAGLLAQGLDAETAAAAGVEAHARAGDLAAGDAPRGLLASDLLAALRPSVNPRS